MTDKIVQFKDKDNNNLYPMLAEEGIPLSYIQYEELSGGVNPDPLPIIQGGTGANTAAQARKNLGLTYTMIGELLWENASPKSVFPAQTLSIPWQNYKFLDILIGHYNTASYGSLVRIGINDTYNAGFFNSTVPIENRYLFMYGRTYELLPTGIKLNNGYSRDISADVVGTENSKYAIPIAIYGIKVVS